MTAGVKESSWGSVRTWESPHLTVAGKCHDSAEEQNPQVRVISRDLTWKSKQWQRKGGLKACVGNGCCKSFLHRMGTPPEWLEDLLASTFCPVSYYSLSFLFPFACANTGHLRDCEPNISWIFIIPFGKKKTGLIKACLSVYQNTPGFAAGLATEWQRASRQQSCTSGEIVLGEVIAGESCIRPLTTSFLFLEVWLPGSQRQLCSSAT